MFCHQCGAEIKEGTLFCYRCGSPVSGEEANEQEKPELSNTELNPELDEKSLERMEAKQASLEDAAIRDEQYREEKTLQKQKKLPKRIEIAFGVIAAVLAVASVVIFVVLPLLLGNTSLGPVRFTTIETYASENVDELKSMIVKVTNTSGDGKIAGTGFFTSEGYLVTGSNIIDTDGEITITYADGTETSATAVSNDLYTNTAVLKVDSPTTQAFVFSDEASNDAMNLMVIGYNESKNETEVIEVTGEVLEDENIIHIDQGLDRGTIGAPIVDANGEVLGVVTLADANLGFALAGSAASLEETANALAVNQAVQKEEDIVRNNLYTEEAINQYGVKAEDLYTEGTFIRGSYTGETQLNLSVDQRNGGLIMLRYDGSGMNSEKQAILGEGSNKATVTVETTEGEFRTEVDKAIIKAGDQGYIPLEFAGYSGTAKNLTIDPAIIDKPDSSQPVIIELETYSKDAVITQKTSEEIIAELENDPEFMDFVTNYAWKALAYKKEYSEDDPGDLISLVINFPNQFEISDYFPDCTRNTENNPYVLAVEENALRWYVQTFFNVSEDKFEAYKQTCKGDEKNYILYEDGWFYTGAAGWGEYSIKIVKMFTAIQKASCIL